MKIKTLLGSASSLGRGPSLRPAASLGLILWARGLGAGDGASPVVDGPVVGLWHGDGAGPVGDGLCVWLWHGSWPRLVELGCCCDLLVAGGWSLTGMNLLEHVIRQTNEARPDLTSQLGASTRWSWSATYWRPPRTCVPWQVCLMIRQQGWSLDEGAIHLDPWSGVWVLVALGQELHDGDPGSSVCSVSVLEGDVLEIWRATIERSDLTSVWLP